MNRYPTVFHLISTIFAERKVTSILIGGFAVNFHKVSRQTADVDFMMTRVDYEIIAQDLFNYPELREYKDFPDILNLIHENNFDYTSDDFRTLCLKFGTETLYKRIKDHFDSRPKLSNKGQRQHEQ